MLPCLRLVPDAEVMYVVSEVLAELPRPHHWQFTVLVGHVRLTEAILQHCSIPRERHGDAVALLHKIAVRPVIPVCQCMEYLLYLFVSACMVD